MKNIFFTSALIALLSGVASAQATNTARAVVVLTGSAGVSGEVVFEQLRPDDLVVVTGTIRGLTPNAERGLHVHQFGNLTNGCTSTGLHFNPFGKKHGDRTDTERHAGDFGNVRSDSQGIATLNFTVPVISLYGGPTSIIGRGLVVHNGTDDLGRGDSPDSQTTGASGGRAACGIIGIAV